MCSVDIFLGLLAVLFPPLPVWVKRGLCSCDSIINILLCVLGYIPGLIHSWYIIAKFPDPEYEYESLPQDDERGRVYIFVQDARPPPRQPQPRADVGYGATNGVRAPAPASSPAPAHAPQPHPHDGGEGSSDGAAPPSYAQVVAGDNKIQSQD